MTTNDMDEIKTHLRRLEDKLDKYMLGDMGKHNGLLARVTRLETTEEHRRWHVRALWTAILAVFARLILDVLTG